MFERGEGLIAHGNTAGSSTASHYSTASLGKQQGGGEGESQCEKQKERKHKK